jgi:hypothetical protein
LKPEPKRRNAPFAIFVRGANLAGGVRSVCGSENPLEVEEAKEVEEEGSRTRHRER